MKYFAIYTDYLRYEKEVHSALRKEINASKINSKHISNCKIIKVNVFDYTELAIIHDQLTFMDNDGLQYSLHAECSLEDLIDILTQIS